MDYYVDELYKVGAEHKTINFTSFWDWFVKITPLSLHWNYQPTYLITQGVFVFGALATFLHAFLRGGRLPYLWFGTLLHGLVVECMSYIVPDIDNFWHSQTPLMFLGRRLPLHIVFLYPCFIYNASIGVAKARLPRWAEPFAVGLATVLVDIPYDIVSVNFLHWTWHDTDPNIADRHYWVPWNSYYFHACFAASFTFWFHFSRKLICKSEGKWIADKSIIKEVICTIIAGILGTPGGIVLFLPIYHPLHDLYRIHSEVTFFILFAVFLLIIWSADRNARKDDLGKTHFVHRSTWLPLLHLVMHYSWFLCMLVFFKPEDEISIGLKEPVGPCDQYVPVNTIFGKILQKRKYLCATDYDEKYFNWKCLPNSKPPSHGCSWYTTCGVPLPNKAEFIAIVSVIWLIGITVFSNLHFRSCGDGIFDFKENSINETAKLKDTKVNSKTKKVTGSISTAGKDSISRKSKKQL